jgi:thiol-disulfide isomerase/thioredoxin
MNIHLLVLLVATALLTPALTQGQSAEIDKSPGASTPTPSKVQSELEAIIKSINLKLVQKKGNVTVSDLEADLKAFDALLAQHAGEKTEDLARVMLMKARLYSQVLRDKATAGKVMQQLKADYKGTKLVTSLEEEQAAQAGAEKAQEAVAPGRQFPDFDEKDLAGKPLSVGNFRGKVVLVDFWATWCGPCVRELPNVIETYKKFHTQGFEIIGISLDSERSNLEAFLKKNEAMTWQQYFDGLGWQNKIAGKYGVRSIPFTVLVGPDGKVINNDLRGEALGEAVEKALKK